METLPEILKRSLIQREPNTSVVKLVEYLQKYENLSLADFPNMAADKRAAIEEHFKSFPNPNEQAEWNQIKPMLSDPSQQVLDMLSTYISNWENTLPAGNHVEEARQHLVSIKQKLDDIAISIESGEWDNLDITSKEALKNYLYKYPSTVHKDEIDEMYWALVNKEVVSEIMDYLSVFPSGKHVYDANSIMDALLEWGIVRDKRDIFEINDYIRENPKSPFFNQARLLLTQLKQDEIFLMKREADKYKKERLLAMLSDGIFAEWELINNNVLTQRILNILRDPNLAKSLPDVAQSQDNSVIECKDGYTDVYFFGVPSTGKSCILMGLSRSNSIDVNLAHGGGEYAQALQQYVDAGMLLNQTQIGFVATLEAEISDDEKGCMHKINLVEMAGEDFARKIAGNEEHIYDFESMGHGVTELLSNNNKKVFFLIIDPTTNFISYDRVETVGYNEETGDEIRQMVNIRCNQQILIDKMIALFAHESNREIMKKVDAIHVVMTKADLIADSPLERNELAFNHFMSSYGEKIVNRLIRLGKEYNINVGNNYRPILYTFSLGKFYPGGVYEYDSTDSNKLAEAIKNSTRPTKNKTLWDIIKEKVN